MSNIFSREYWRWWSRGEIGRHPSIYGPIERLKRSFNPEYRDLAVTRNSDIVVEGYARCGNTFAANALKYTQGKDLKVAFRCHSPTQVILAVRYDLPSLIVTRNPIDSVISSYIHNNSQLDADFLLHHYILFYKSIWHLRDHFVVSDFAITTKKFSTVIHALNAKYDLSLTIPETDDISEEVFQQIDKFYIRSRKEANVNTDNVSRPSEDRKIKAEIVRKHILETCSPSLLQEAQNQYKKYVEIAIK